MPPNLLYLLSAAIGNHDVCDGLCSKNGGSQYMDFGLGSRPFSSIKRVHGEVNEYLIG